MLDPSLTITDQERAAGALRPDRHRRAALLLHAAGCVILRGLLSPARIGEVHRAFMAVFDDCVASKQGDTWYQVSGRHRAVFWERGARWRIFPRLIPPFNDPALLANGMIMLLFADLLGVDFSCKFVSSDTCVRGSVRQAPHREYSTAGAVRPAAYVVNIPLVASGLENGPMEAWPAGTHLWRPEMLARYGLVDDVQDGENPDMEAFARDFPSRRLTLDPGDVLIRDPGMLHRGTPNPTEAPRPMLTICYARRGHANDYGDVRYNLDDDLHARLAPAVRRLFAWG